MRLRCVAFAALITMPAGAQVAASRARPDSTNAPPHFPAMLRAARVGGTVRASIVVDTTGHVVPGSVRVIHADHELFVASLRNAAMRWHFLPAHGDGRALADTIEQDVTFAMPRDPAIAITEPAVLARTTVAPGHYRLVIGWPEGDPAPAPLDSATTSEIVLAALDTLAASLVPRDTARLARIACVHVADTVNVAQPDAPAMRRLARAQLAVVVSRRCPPTFASMVARIGPDGRMIGSPPGENPYVIDILAVRPYAVGIALVRAVVRQGTASTHYRCRADRDGVTPSTWRVACETSGVEVSQTQFFRPHVARNMASQ